MLIGIIRQPLERRGLLGCHWPVVVSGARCRARNLVKATVIPRLTVWDFRAARTNSASLGTVRGGTCIGSHRLYEFLHDNALFEFRPIEYVADPEVVVRNYKMASLTQAFAIDLTGQVCADQFHGEFYGVPPLSPTFTAAPPNHPRASQSFASHRRQATAGNPAPKPI